MAYEDLLKDTSESFEDGNYFLVTITELDLATQYPLQFRWKYKDGTYGKDWSGVYYVTTPGATVPLEPNLDVTDVVGGAGFIKVTWNGKDASNNTIENIDRVDIYISGTSFPDGSKPAGNFKESGTQTFTAEPGIYIVQLKAVRVDGTTSFFSSARTVTVTEVGEPNDPPVAPTGFSARAILGGIELTWNGTYSGGAAWSGFQAVNIYAGTSTAATGGTYIKVGQMTANKTTNKIVIPIDGTYVRYGFPAYIHASSINKATPPAESSISANVASATPSRVVNTDLIDAIISEAKIALSAVTETKIANDAITTPKIVSGAITAAKIAALTITADQIAANTIDVGKLAANTISVGNLEAGDIKATSFIRAGTAGSARVEISSSTVGSVLPGLTVYDSGGNQMLRAPLTGGLTITGALTATSISTSSGNFTVSTGGVLTAKSADIDGTIKATAGYIGGTTSGIYIANGAIQNNASGSQFKLDSSGKARFGSSSANAIIIDPTAAVGGYYIYHSSDGGAAASGKFSVSTGGILTATGASFSGTITNGSDYWNADNTFRLGGANGINKSSSTSNAITIGSDVTISGSVTASSLNTTNLTISSTGAITNTSTTPSPFSVTAAGALTSTSGSIGGWTIGSTTITSNTGGTTLYNNGKIEIGVTGDDSLKINAGANIAMFAASGNASIINFYTTTSPTLADSRIQQTSGGDLQIRGWYGGTYRTALAAYTYIMQGALAQSYFNGSTTATLIVRRDNPSSSDLSTDIATTTRMIQFQKSYADGGTYTGVGGINASNTTTNPGFYAGSDERLKKNIEVFNDTTIIKDIKKINTYKFHDLSVSDDSRKTIGFMAKEFYPKYPDIVIGKPDEIDEDGNPVYMQIMRENLIPHLFNAIKYLAGKVEELEERINNV